ncbi:uncharacterized protein LOC126835408 isoform X2 [Adelges cooleyi]|uniref:uncharacterized protein LOC126835408 isoform X2 n=1 Tax=Adelges cooleyi TaxID=133065 RepID=UPI00218048DD|nr:uncharacterized protein LOC126835408 isoform X2 [Adelges cooleyi]
MYFKISILLLTCLISAKTAPTDTDEGDVLKTELVSIKISEEDVLKAIYNVCKIKLNVPNDRGLDESQMAKYAGIDDVLELRKIANSIEIKHLDNIDLEIFMSLVKEITKRLNVPILGSEGDTESSLEDDNVLKTIYSFAKRDFDATDRGLTVYELARYMEVIDVLELKKIANLHGIENLDDISLETFELLTKEMFEKTDIAELDPNSESEADDLSNKPTLDEDVYLEREFDNIKMANDVPDGSGLNESQMANYAGFDDVLELREIANKIGIDSLDNINLETFKKLMKKMLGVPILSGPRKNLIAGPSNMATLVDDLVLVKIYCLARKEFGAIDRGLTEYEMANFMAVVDVLELKKIASSIGLDNLDDNINLEKFMLLTKEICKNFDVSSMVLEKELEDELSNSPSPEEQADESSQL